MIGQGLLPKRSHITHSPLHYSVSKHLSLSLRSDPPSQSGFQPSASSHPNGTSLPESVQKSMIRGTASRSFPIPMTAKLAPGRSSLRLPFWYQRCLGQLTSAGVDKGLILRPATRTRELPSHRQKTVIEFEEPHVKQCIRP